MGRPRLLDKKLLAKIAKKAGKDEINISKSVSALARRMGISAESALIVFAQNFDVGSETVRRKLSADKQSEIRSVLNRSYSVTEHKASSRKRAIRPYSYDQDPFLPGSLYSGLSIQSLQAYQLLFVLENSIRSFIVRVLSKRFGHDWWSNILKTKSTTVIGQKVLGRKKNEAANWYHGHRGAHEIYYADYEDLLQIMRSFDSVFSVYFRKGSAKNLPSKLAELIPTRNVVAHNNPVTKADLLRLQVHASDWIKYMQYLFGKREN
jgi:hypothetical protein